MQAGRTGKSMNLCWRQRMINLAGPAFNGMTVFEWYNVLRENRFSIDPQFWPRALVTTLRSVLNTPFAIRESSVYSTRIEKVEVLPPLFVLGHWRSGTTHLFNLLCLDRRFAYPNLFQVMSPKTFLTTEKFATRIDGLMMPRVRPFDNVALRMDVPYEDEFIAWHAAGLTSYMTWNFPRAAARYDRYLTFQEAAEQEVARWKWEFLRFLKKLTFRYQRPLILKSPPHTCRIKLLLDLFPNAKFVHIHRNPYTVFLSTRKLYENVLPMARLQRHDPGSLDNRIVRQYREMYDRFFEERALIPDGQFCEARFEDLEEDPVGQTKMIYEKLDLPDFSAVKSSVTAYMETLGTYKKNKHPVLEPHVHERIKKEWQRSFEQWGYEK